MVSKSAIRKTWKPCQFALYIIAGALLLHVGAPLIYQICISGVRASQQQRIQAGGSNEEWLHVSKKSFEDYYDKHGQELEVNGVRYDVADYEKRGNVVACHVLRDDAEEILANGARQQAGEQSIAHKFLLWFALYWERPAPSYLHRAMLANNGYSFAKDERFILRVRNRRDGPPPEHCTHCC